VYVSAGEGDTLTKFDKIARFSPEYSDK